MLQSPSDPLRLYEQLLDSATTGIFSVDHRLRCTFWNDAMQAMLGLSRAQVLGKRLPDMFPFLVETGEDRALLRAVGGETVLSEQRPFCIEGTSRRGFYDAKYTPLRGSDGELCGASAWITDITQRKLERDLLAETEQRFQQMADASPVLLWMSGTDSRCNFFNQSWLDFTGRALEEELGVGWAEGIHFEDFERCMSIYTSSFNERLPFEMEYRLRRADGEYRWLLDRGTPRRLPDGTFAGYIGSCVDITDRRLREAELRRGVRARDEFLSVASHELRTPLTSLRLQLDGLLRALDRGEEASRGERIAHNAARARGQAIRLSSLVDTLLDVSRISEGGLALELEDVDLAALVHEVAENLQDAARYAQSDISVHATQELRGLWDRVRLEQVVTNLLSNAIKYGGGRPIDVVLEDVESRARLTVVDRGIGIAEEHHSRIFQRFERAVSARNYGGFGLGLWITREVVTALGGDIQVASKVGDGSRFTIDLPRKSPSARPARAP